jgi:hypothetical protein
MERILQLLTDPTWWFTVVLCGIIASLAASYLRDGLSALLAKWSTPVRVRREQRLKREQR